MEGRRIATTTNEIAAAVLAGQADVMELWEAVRRLAYSKAIRWLRATERHMGVEIDDLMQAAFLALLESLDYWKPEAGAFTTVYVLRLMAQFTVATGQRTTREKRDPLNAALSLDSPIPGTDDATLSDILEDPETLIDDVAEADYARSRSRDIRRALGVLNKMQRQVVVLRYFGGLTIAKTAERMNSTPSRVTTAEKKAIRRLKRSRILAEYRQ